jgi:hypothetical protein
MPKLTLRRDDAEYTIEDLTFEQVKELVGVNGYGRHHETVAPVTAPPAQLRPRPVTHPDFKGFVDAISDRGKDFISLLKHHPEGIEANSLAGKLGYNDAKQIGGLTGGGLAKKAKSHAIELKDDVYRVEITFHGGKRTVMFYPGKFILDAVREQEKPAV